MHAITRLAPRLREQKFDEYRVLGTTIEASILKLSLMRSKAHNAIYGYCDGGMTRALAQMSEIMGDEEEKLAEEERKLDKELEEYEELVGLVNGEYLWIVEEWTRVKEEENECRRDLQRMGWVQKGE